MEELPVQPSGIWMQEDFINADHEAELLTIFKSLEWPVRKGRLSLHFGYSFSYKTFGVDLETPYKPFPDWLVPLLPTTEPRSPDQVTLQYYPPGTGIPPHADTHGAYDQLYALSLGCPVSMQFRSGDSTQSLEVTLPPRSMMQMRGDARLHWTHGIRARKTDTLENGDVKRRGDRWSITYRWIREGGECECGDAKLCDTVQKRKGLDREYRWKDYETEKRETNEGDISTGERIDSDGTLQDK